MILEKIDWKEYHPNGKIWITGQIGIVAGSWKHLYEIRDNFKGYEGQSVCRLGKWTKHYDNGQLAWELSYNDYGFYIPKNTPRYRKDGTIITN